MHTSRNFFFVSCTRKYTNGLPQEDMFQFQLTRPRSTIYLQFITWGISSDQFRPDMIAHIAVARGDFLHPRFVKRFHECRDILDASWPFFRIRSHKGIIHDKIIRDRERELGFALKTLDEEEGGGIALHCARRVHERNTPLRMYKPSRSSNRPV